MTETVTLTSIAMLKVNLDVSDTDCSGPRFLDSPIRCILLREDSLTGGPDEQESAEVFGGI